MCSMVASVSRTTDVTRLLNANSLFRKIIVSVDSEVGAACPEKIEMGGAGACAGIGDTAGSAFLVVSIGGTGPRAGCDAACVKDRWNWNAGFGSIDCCLGWF